MSLTGAARALSHPTRLLILKHLRSGQERVSANSFYREQQDLTLGHVDYHLHCLDRVKVARRLPTRMRLTDTSRPEWVYDLDGVEAGKAIGALDVFHGRRGISAKGSDPLGFAMGEEELMLLAKLLSNSLCVRTILALQRKRSDLLSPAEAARMFDLNVSVVAYPFARLRDLGIAEIKATRQRRGATEHLHALGGVRAAAALALLRILADQVELVQIPSAVGLADGVEQDSALMA